MAPEIDEKTVFVRLDEYKEALVLFEKLKDKIIEAKNILSKIDQLQNEEKSELELWHNSLQEIERKVAYVDSLIIGKDQ